MVALARACALAIIIFVLASTLPIVAHKATSTRSGTPVVFYSSVLERFVMQKSTDNGLERFDENGTPLDYVAYCRALPFMFHGNLAKWGQWDSMVKGQPFTAEQIARRMQFIRLSPRDINTPEPPLGLLMESSPRGTNLEYPPDMFRLGERLEFLDCKTNRVNADKSQRFTAALKDAGFTFPGVLAAMNPTNQKPFDWGAFLLDGTGRLFHLLMVKGEPVCRNTGQRFDQPVRKIIVAEAERREFYALVVTETDIHAIACDGYRRMTLPLKGYSPDTDSVRILATPLNIMVQQQTPTTLRSVALDTTWSEVHSLSNDIYNPTKERRAELVAFFLPFKITTSSPLSRFAGIAPTDVFAYPLWSAAGCLFAILLYIPLHRRRFRRLPKAADILLLAGTGFYGLVAMAAFGPLASPDE